MDLLTATFRSGNILRSRTVSAIVQSAVLDAPVPPEALMAHWQREISVHLGLEAGDIEALSFARTRRRWSELHRCVDAVRQWMLALGLPDMLSSAEAALMASRGTPYHHDGERYGRMAFCNFFLSDDNGTDFHFPAAGHRIALARGTVVIFDPCQPHAIIKRSAAGFDEADFTPEAMPPQVFLTWELPIEQDAVAQGLGIRFDRAPPNLPEAQREHVWRGRTPVTVCAKTGGWLNGP